VAAKKEKSVTEQLCNKETRHFITAWKPSGSLLLVKSRSGSNPKRGINKVPFISGEIAI